MKILAGNSNLSLAQEIATYLDLPLAECAVRRFADNEVFVEILENMRGEDVFLIQSTSFPANDHLMELLIMMNAASLGDGFHRWPVQMYHCRSWPPDLITW